MFNFFTIDGGTLYTRILGTGGYLPQAVRTNFDLEKMVDTSDEWIVERTGIRQRHIANEQETASFMGSKAALLAIESAGIDKNSIDTIICATTSSTHAFPSTACQIGNEIGITNVAAFDVSAACAGFSYAYSIAHSMIISGASTNVLIVGVDLLSKACDINDRSTIIIFGDGAGACILSKSDIQGTITTLISSDPSCGDLLSLPYAKRGVLDTDSYLYMKGNDVFKRAVTVLSDLVTKTLEKANMSADDLDFLVPHQANLRIITATARKLKLDMSSVIVTLDKQGNTSAASVPLALDEGIRSGRIKRGDVLLLESFGGGFTWGSALIKY